MSHKKHGICRLESKWIKIHFIAKNNVILTTFSITELQAQYASFMGQDCQYQIDVEIVLIMKIRNV